MSISAISSTSALDDLGIATKTQEEVKSGELGQKAFLELMITQMENQDPLNPQENSEFIAQLAQFSSVEALDSMNNKFDNLTENFVANQALQASSLVGSSVAVPTKIASLDSSGMVAVSVDDIEGVRSDREPEPLTLWLGVSTEAVSVSDCDGVIGNENVALCDDDAVLTLRLRDAVPVMDPPE